MDSDIQFNAIIIGGALIAILIITISIQAHKNSVISCQQNLIKIAVGTNQNIPIPEGTLVKIKEMCD